MDYKRASYLSERAYKGLADSPNQELEEYWEKVLGRKNLDFVIERYKDKLPYFLCENEYDTNDWEKADWYVRARQMYGSVRRGKEEIWQQADREKVIFPDFYEPFLILALQCLEERTEERERKGVLSGYLNALAERLQSVSLRTLILEMYVCRQEGKLKGEDSACEYEYYQKHFLSKPEYIETLQDYYPVMFRCLMEVIDMSADLYSRMCQRFNEDLDEINRHFYPGSPASEIVVADGKMADTHRNGQSVQKLVLDNGETLIYKPHSVKNETVFAEMVHWIYDKCKEEYQEYGILDKKEYGWCQFVEYRSCTSMEELQNYYRKLGMNLFTAYFLGTGDLHFENLIANGADPVIVDVETLTKMPQKLQSSDVNGQIRKNLEHSVLYLGLLPFYSWDRNGNGVNISAVSGTAGQVAQVKVPRLVNQRTADMHIEYQNPVMEGSSNLALLNGKFAEPTLFAVELEEGFEKAYRAVLQDKEAYFDLIQAVLKTQSRYLVRDTQQYGMALMSSYHPDFLSDGVERELSLMSLYEGKTEEEKDRLTVESEMEELLKGDIPYFYYDAHSTSLHGGSGREIPEYFETTIMEYLEKRLWSLDERDLQMQKKYIQMSMNMMPENGKSLFNSFQKGLTSQGNEVLVKEELLTSAEMIGDWLLENAIYNKDHTQVGWTGVVLAGFREQEWHIQPVNLYLYGGVAGICLFFHALSQKLPKVRYKTICQILDQMLFDYTDTVSKEKSKLWTHNTGAYEGEGSIVWTYQLVYQLTGEEKYLSYARKHCAVMGSLIEEDSLYDLLQGNAGAAAVFLHMWTLTGEKEYLDLAVQAGKVLADNAVKMPKGAGWPSECATKPLLGMSHGSSGMQAVLFWLGKETGIAEFTQLAEQALCYENSCYHEEQKNWDDFRDMEVVDEEYFNIGPVAWCHGAAGILKARMVSLNYAPPGVREILQKDINNAFEKTVCYAVRDGHCLCHGSSGNVEIICSAIEEVKDQSLIKKAGKLRNMYVKSLTGLIGSGRKGMLPQEKEHPGLMTGMAGIGYFILCMADKCMPEILFPEVKNEKKVD